MFIHFLKVAFRNLVRGKIFSVINIVSLAAGIMFCTLVFFYVDFELSHDRFFADHNRIYKVIGRFEDVDGNQNLTSLQDHSLVDLIYQNVPAVDHASSLITANGWVRHDEQLLEEKIAFVDTAFFKIFSFEWLIGNPESLKGNKNEVVIAESAARKFFGPDAALSELIGEVLEFPKGNERLFTITGILKDIPALSSITFSMAVPFEHHRFYPTNNNYFGNISLFLKATANSKKEELESTFDLLIEQYLGQKLADARKFYSASYDPNFHFELQPLKKMYLDPDIPTRYESSGYLRSVYIFSAIGLLVLLISSLNYVMLTSGRLLQRMKEVGMRKVMGSGNSNIIWQFIGEASFSSFIALVFGLLLAQLIIPVFSELSERELSLDLMNVRFLGFTLGLLVVISFLIGILPGLGIRRLNPTHLFRQRIKAGGKTGYSKFFVILQFSISAVLILTTIVMVRQINFVSQQDTGFNKEKVMVITLPDDFRPAQSQVLKTELGRKPVFQNVTSSDRNFLWGRSSSIMKRDDGEVMEYRIIRIDEDYLETLGIPIVRGENPQKRVNFNQLLVNETFVKTMGWEDPIGRILETAVDTSEIIGVVKDFHFDSMHEPIQPLIMYASGKGNPYWFMYAKINSEDEKEGIAAAEATWKELYPDRPFQYSFLEENLNRQYLDDQRWSKIFTYSSLFAVLLASLGLFGLTLLMVVRRTKEIGIRKSIGASSFTILGMISKDFTIWVLIAFVFSLPLAYLVVQNWLERFAYRIELNWWLFALTGLILFLVAWITISFQTLKAARSNPVDALRYE